MTGEPPLEDLLVHIMERYQASFAAKEYQEENDEVDPLMNAFGISPSLKRLNRQYWGRELGMSWQRLVTEVFRARASGFEPALRVGLDEPCDLISSGQAIDTKYRIGSGDSGTLKKFKAYGALLRERNLEPVLLIVRTDNLPAAISACSAGGWGVLTGDDSFAYIQERTGFDLRAWLEGTAGRFAI
jgi:hypothetical protein